MNMLGCLDRPDSGEITLDGTDILKCKEKELSVIRNKKIGFIFQQFHLLPKLSALENVELPLIYQGMPTKKRREKAAKDLFGHTDVEGETIRISGKKLQDHRSFKRRWIIPERLQRFSDLYSIYSSTKDHAKQHDQQFLCVSSK